MWDVAVIGAGPAGASAALAAAKAGKRVILLERAQVPRYKTCGGGLIGPSLRALPDGFEPPIRGHATSFVFSLGGRLQRTRRSAQPLVRLVQRDEFDASLIAAAKAAGATVRDVVAVTRIAEDDELVCVSTRDGDRIRARVAIGADGSAGRSSAYVGVTYEQTDLGLEVEIPVPAAQSDFWSDRILIDWGTMAGAYGWVFPKGDLLSVGVIAPKGNPGKTRAYLHDFLVRLKLDDIEPKVSSGHLTHCRAAGSPLFRGRVLVAGDAAGLLEPWTREGISFALRSGTLSGQAAARAAETVSHGELTATLEAYASAVEGSLQREMTAGRNFMRAFTRHPRAFHLAVILIPKAWTVFSGIVSGETTFVNVEENRLVRVALALLSRKASIRTGYSEA